MKIVKEQLGRIQNKLLPFPCARVNVPSTHHWLPPGQSKGTLKFTKVLQPNSSSNSRCELYLGVQKPLYPFSFLFLILFNVFKVNQVAVHLGICRISTLILNFYFLDHFPPLLLIFLQFFPIFSVLGYLTSISPDFPLFPQQNVPISLPQNLSIVHFLTRSATDVFLFLYIQKLQNGEGN